MLKANSLEKTISKKEKMVVGLNSGTSADGIDAALVRITGNGSASRIKFIGGKIYKYPAVLEAKIMKYAEPEFDNGKKWFKKITVNNRKNCLSFRIAKAAIKLKNFGT